MPPSKKEKLPQNNEGHMSQEEVANALGLSRNRISEIENKALRKLRYHIKWRYKKEDFL
jgi:DNA-directed RNA polymerase sigma subunit (sigma70/sigma32)